MLGVEFFKEHFDSLLIGCWLPLLIRYLLIRVIFQLNSVVTDSTSGLSYLVKDLGCFGEFRDGKRVQESVRHT